MRAVDFGIFLRLGEYFSRFGAPYGRPLYYLDEEVSRLLLIMK